MEGGQTKDEGEEEYFYKDKDGLKSKKRKRKEIFFNEYIAYDEIDALLSKKAFCNFKKYTKNGTEDTRARKLVYSIKISNIFRERVNKDQYITLFDPKETPLLNEEYGENFNIAYVYYESKAKEIGPYKTFYESKWKEGKTPFHLSILNNKKKYS